MERQASRTAIPFPKRKVSKAVPLRELAILKATYPRAGTALDYRSPFALLVAVILSAQYTDARVDRAPSRWVSYFTRVLGRLDSLLNCADHSWTNSNTMGLPYTRVRPSRPQMPASNE